MKVREVLHVNLEWINSLLWERNGLFMLTWKLKCVVFCCKIVSEQGVIFLSIKATLKVGMEFLFLSKAERYEPVFAVVGSWRRKCTIRNVGRKWSTCNQSLLYKFHQLYLQFLPRPPLKQWNSWNNEITE